MTIDSYETKTANRRRFLQALVAIAAAPTVGLPAPAASRMTVQTVPLRAGYLSYGGQFIPLTDAVLTISVVTTGRDGEIHSVDLPKRGRPSRRR